MPGDEGYLESGIHGEAMNIRPSPIRWLFTATLGLLAGGPGRAAEEGGIPEEIRTVWLNPSSQLPCLIGTVKSETSSKVGQGATQSRVVIRGLKVTPSAARLELLSTPNGQQSRWLCQNPRYTFSVSKSPASDQFALDAFADNPNAVLARFLPSAVREQILGMVSVAYFAGDVRADLLLNATNYRIERVIDSPDRPGSKRVTFRWVGTTATTSAQNGWFDTDPSVAWAITGGEFARLDGNRLNTYQFRTSVKVAKTGVVIPIEREISCVTKMNNGSMTSVVSRTQFELEEVDAIPDSEFSLSAFGFPEPPGVMWEKPTPRYVWFLIGAAVFALLAVGLRFIVRRRIGRT